MKDTTAKICENKLHPVEFSNKVTARFCELLKEGSITMTDQLTAIEELCNHFNPKTIARHPLPYNTIKYQMQKKTIMYFKIDNVIFIPK